MGIMALFNTIIVYRLKETKFALPIVHLAFKFKVNCSRYGDIVLDKMKIS